MAVDLTSIAREIGYTGKTPVLVKDGIVLSHRGISWARFRERVLQGRPLPKGTSLVEQNLAKRPNG
jgi:hypothetical protein